ncbi:MAG TPA: rhomboid family intramembrane serine protease [archaeon]|nr:rhomboid family intramembrane serine protease [archaeon]
METAGKKEKFGWDALKLAVIIAVIFLLQNLFPDFLEQFALASSGVFQQPWTLVTYIFLHGNANHLISNLFPLAMFGLILEKIIGSQKFLIIFFAAGIFAGMISTFFYPSVIGASGAIFSIMGVLVGIRPKMVVLAFGIPIPMIIAVILWVALDLGGVFYPSSIANIGHLAGLSVGIIFGMWLRPKYKLPEEKKKDEIKFDEEYFRKWEEKHMKPKH